MWPESNQRFDCFFILLEYCYYVYIDFMPAMAQVGLQNIVNMMH